jgi:hypothetical protein
MPCFLPAKHQISARAKNLPQHHTKALQTREGGELKGKERGGGTRSEEGSISRKGNENALIVTAYNFPNVRMR